MEYKFNSQFAIAPEVVFAAQGGKDTRKVDLVDADCTFHTNYINVPVMLKYYATPAFSIDFGPQVGFNVYSKYTIKGPDNKYVTNNKKYTKAVDFGLGLGATYNLTDNAFVQARYTLGLTNVFKDDFNESKNGNIQLSIGYRF